MSLYYYVSIWLLALSIINTFLLLGDTEFMEKMPQILQIVVVSFHFFLAFYAYMSNRAFRKVFDKQYGR